MDAHLMQDLLVDVASNGLWTVLASSRKVFKLLKAAAGKDLIADIYTGAAISIYRDFPDAHGQVKNGLA